MKTGQLLKTFHERFPQGHPPVITRSPGRVNIIGEHTDYNDGFVLPAAIDKAACLAIAPREDNEIHLHAFDLEEKYIGRTENLKPVDAPGWPNYILGVAAQFHKANVPLRGFNALLSSDVPVGAGLSSSAAIECATVMALQKILNTEFEKPQLIKMAQKAEHEYAGVMCGVMDQFASMMGKKDHVIKLDCRSLEYEYVPLALPGVKIVLFDTNIKHALASSEYNLRRQECQQAVDLISKYEPAVKSLRDASLQMLDKYVQPKNPLAYRRARYVVQEIQRVLSACTDLHTGHLQALGKKMFDTHSGLSKLYNVSCNELDWLVDYVKDNASVIGARMMGGGFGGCTINLVKEEAIDQLVQQVVPAYERAMGRTLSVCVAEIEEGANVVYDGRRILEAAK